MRCGRGGGGRDDYKVWRGGRQYSRLAARTSQYNTVLQLIIKGIHLDLDTAPG